MNILFSDVSEWQTPIDDGYPYQVLSIRANDGTYQDKKFPGNYAWACGALNSGKLGVLIVYLVYRRNWQQTLDTTKAMIGTPHPHCAVMIDVESWGGQISGDNSDSINRLYWGLADWLGDPARVIAYGNTNDLDTLWPTKPPGVRLIVAAYGSNPDYPGKLAHQFTDGVSGGPLLVTPFGAADVNSADGYDLTAFSAALGIGDDMTPEQASQLNDIWHMLYDPVPSHVPGSTYTARVRDYILNIDDATYLTRQDTTGLAAAVGVLQAAISALAVAVAARHEISPVEFTALLDAELARIVKVQVSVTDNVPPVP